MYVQLNHCVVQQKLTQRRKSVPIKYSLKDRSLLRSVAATHLWIPVTRPPLTDAVTSPVPPELPANEGVRAEAGEAPLESVLGGVASLGNSVLTHCWDPSTTCISANSGASSLSVRFFLNVGGTEHEHLTCWWLLRLLPLLKLCRTCLFFSRADGLIAD